jgi:hypothetical protein
MTLTSLKAALVAVGTTGVGSVIFDWQTFLNEPGIKTYPVVLWNLSGAGFKKDSRTKVKVYTITVFIINKIETGEEKLTKWDAMEVILDAYLAYVNAMTGITIENIDNVDGDYYAEGLISVDSEIGLSYKVELKTWC